MKGTAFKKYKQEYNREYYAKKGWYKRWMEAAYGYKHLKVEPTEMNFKGSDCDEPRLCCHFGCGRKLSLVEEMSGKFCIHHQSPKKIDVAMHLSYPIKQTG